MLVGKLLGAPARSRRAKVCFRAITVAVDSDGALVGLIGLGLREVGKHVV
jgi:hypothetical protein